MTRKKKTVDPEVQRHRITRALAATRYPWLDQPEGTWPSRYQTIVNDERNRFGLKGPDGIGFIYPSIVVLDGDSVRGLAMVEPAAQVTAERAAVWRFLCDCIDEAGPSAGFSLYVPLGQEKKARELLGRNGMNAAGVHNTRVVGGNLAVDGELIEYVVEGVGDSEMPEDQQIRSEAQRNRVIRIIAHTRYPYLDQGDSSWSPTYRVAINDETRRFGIPGPTGILYPSIVILDKGDVIRGIGLIEPPENIRPERAEVWRFLSSSITSDDPPIIHLFFHVPHGLEAKARDILESNHIPYDGLRGYSVVEGRLKVSLIITRSAGDHR